MEVPIFKDIWLLRRLYLGKRSCKTMTSAKFGFYLDLLWRLSAKIGRCYQFTWPLARYNLRRRNTNISFEYGNFHVTVSSTSVSLFITFKIVLLQNLTIWLHSIIGTHPTWRIFQYVGINILLYSNIQLHCTLIFREMHFYDLIEYGHLWWWKERNILIFNSTL